MPIKKAVGGVFLTFIVHQLVKTPPLDELINQDPIETRRAKPEDLNDVVVKKLTKCFHLSSELSEALKGIGVELFNRNGDSVGESSFINVSEAALADDEIGGEVFGGGGEFLHVEMGEGGVKGGAFAGGEGGRVRGGSGSVQGASLRSRAGGFFG
ncbi:hypothetical protein V6N13_120767 [Hibiscus sabdariffa]|uniref:Uncharacterized protein n=1 Tax=Hibiscus sabdariffa TaxID=183260 RepID=A0ABR2E572_9ROSI